MREAIRTGVPAAVEALLHGISDRAQAVTQLTTTYGGASCGRADKDGLLKDTYPVLHAALGGNPSMFRVVFDAMMKLLSSSQVRYCYLWIDQDFSKMRGRTRVCVCGRGGGGCGCAVAMHQYRRLNALEAEL